MSTIKRQGTTTVEVDNLAPADQVRLARLGRELRLTDQILSADLDQVSIVMSGPAPAWTTLDGDHVSFALGRMPFPETAIDVAVWLGTNAHELGHVLFSPRRHSTLMGRVIEGDRMYLRGIADLCNIVEDQRQERLILARFAPWRAYLTAALGHHLKARSRAAWLLFAGRTWLPAAVRAEARAEFVSSYGEATAVEVAQIVGEYQALADPGEGDSDEAWRLLVALHNLFGTNLPDLPARCQPLAGGEPETGEAGEGAPATAAEAEEAGEGEAPAEAGEEEEGNAGEGGTGTGKGNLKSQIRQAAQRQLEEAATAEELADILGALDIGRPGDEVNGEAPVGQYVPVTDDARRLHHEVGDALLDLKDESEPGWVRRQDSGRLIPRRLATGASYDELFDRYEPGQMDASELELVLLVDVSGSMSRLTGELAEAVWAIRHAVDDLEGRCSVIAWDSGPHRVLAAPGVRPDDRMFIPHAMGGTLPTSALAEAHRLLSDSQARNRLMVVLTDGEWSLHGGRGNPEAIIQAMNEAGVVTVCALLGNFAEVNLHHCTFGGVIATPSDLARMFGQVAAARINSWR